jgi:hypothetical protein
MSFHKKILLSFLIFHFVFTFSVLVVEYLLASSGAYDDYGVHFTLVVVFQIVLMSALSVALVAIAYVSRVVWSRARQRRQHSATS